MVQHQATTVWHFSGLCEKISVNSTTVTKNDIASSLKNNRSIFYSIKINTVICQVSPTVSLLRYIISNSPKTLPQFLSGIVHFFVISWVARYIMCQVLLTISSEHFCSVFFLDSENWSCATFSVSSLPIINIAHFPDHVNNKFQISYDRSKSIRQNNRIA